MAELYFSHDSDARNDPKLAALVYELGLLGYGRFWVLVEVLREQPDYRLALEPVTFVALAKEWTNTVETCSPDEAEKLIRSFIERYKVLEADESSFWAPSLLRRMAKMERAIAQRRRAGLASAAARWGPGNDDSGSESADSVTAVEQTQNAVEGPSSKGKGKGKGKSKIAYRERVRLTQDENDRLVNAYGQWLVDQCYDKLDAWKGAKGKRTKSDYKAISLWVVGAVNEDLNKGRISRPHGTENPDDKYGRVGSAV